MLNQFSRAQLSLGVPTVEKLKASRATIFGFGGVGGYITEALARSSTDALDLIDGGKVCLTDLNHQILTLRLTVGRYKAEVAAVRVAGISPDCRMTVHHTFYLPKIADHFGLRDYNYMVDTIDTVTGKIQFILQTREANTRIINCIGADNKLDPIRFTVADTYKTSVNPLVRVMRRELKKQDVREYKVVCSTEAPVRPLEDPSISCRDHCVCPPGVKRKYAKRRDIPGSMAFIPAVTGLILAGKVVREFVGKREV